MINTRRVRKKGNVVVGDIDKIPYFCNMKTVIQRVTEASVSINGTLYSHIGKGFLILLGVADDDTEDDVDWLVHKTAALRIFDDDKGVMNLSLKEVEGEVLVVSQFTLLASYKKGNRPSWIHAAPHSLSIPLYESFCRKLENELHKEVQTGQFGANMQVSLVNDGPVTICMDTKHKE